MMQSCDFIRQKQEIESEILLLKTRIIEKEKALQNLIEKQKNHTLTNREISKYCRQIIVPSVGVKGQEQIKASSALIIGCGGLGCPAAQYLAGCGIGKLGLVDYDVVEDCNIHRQLLHNENNIGLSKVKSASEALKKLNKELIVDEYNVQLDSSNALEIIGKYDVVVDATDNVTTRYLINDACVMKGKPLVSGSAVRTEGQLTVLNYNNGPCYRCLFPTPSPPETVANCSDSGVLGPVPGVIGVLQALQVMYIVTGNTHNVLSRSLMLFDGVEMEFRKIKLRDKIKTCVVCSDTPTVTKLIDYVMFCGAPPSEKNPNLKLLEMNERITPEELYNNIMNRTLPLIIDVRPQSEFEICSLPGSINIPLKELTLATNRKFLETKLQEGCADRVCVVCRRGNDSQLGVLKLKELFKNEIPLSDLKGGLHAWARSVDKTFPVY